MIKIIILKFHKKYYKVIVKMQLLKVLLKIKMHYVNFMIKILKKLNQEQKLIFIHSILHY